MKKILFLSIALNLLAFSYAQEPANDSISRTADSTVVAEQPMAEQSTTVSEPTRSFELRGSLRGLGKVFTESPMAVDLLETRLKLELLSTLGKKTAFRAEGYIIYQYPPSQLKFDLKNAYLDYYTKYIDFRLGQQVISWGKADELNPTDVLNPQDLTNLTEDKYIRKIGLFEAKVDVKLWNFLLTGIWKPVFQYMQIPPYGSRWSFFSIPGVTTLPPPTYPNVNLSNTEWAFKLSRTIGPVDFSLSYFDGWDNIYTPTIAMDTSTHSPVVTELSTHRTKMFGADFATSLWSVGLWGEGAYFLTEDYEGTLSNIKNPYFEFVIGADYEFKYKFKLNVQYYQEIITMIGDDAERDKEEAIPSKLGIGLPLQQALTLRFEKKFGREDQYKAELFGIYDLKYKGIYLVPKFSYSPEDAFNIEAGYVIFDGVSPSFWARFQHNDEIYLKCTYSF